MAVKTKKARYSALRPHASRIVKLAEFPTHVNGGYLDNPDRIPTFGSDRSRAGDGS